MAQLTLEMPVLEKQSPTWRVGLELGNSFLDESESHSEDGKYVSEELYWEEYYEHPLFSYEWNNGYLEEMPMTNRVEYSMYHWFVKTLDQYLEVHPMAQTIGLEAGFRLALPHKTSIRKPDLGVVLHHNPILLHDKDRKFNGIFDICIEAVSASNRKSIERDTVVKRGEYGTIGVREYYILDERGNETAFLENVGGIFLPMPEVDGVISSNVLPGFQFRKADLYKQPTLIELAEDAVYQGFILPEYQQACQRAEWERSEKERVYQLAEQEWLRAESERREKEHAYQRVEQEKQRAEQEYQRAENERREKDHAYQRIEQLAAKLRALGVDPSL